MLTKGTHPCHHRAPGVPGARETSRVNAKREPRLRLMEDAHALALRPTRGLKGEVSSREGKESSRPGTSAGEAGGTRMPSRRCWSTAALHWLDQELHANWAVTQAFLLPGRPSTWPCLWTHWNPVTCMQTTHMQITYMQIASGSPAHHQQDTTCTSSYLSSSTGISWV